MNDEIIFKKTYGRTYDKDETIFNRVNIKEKRVKRYSKQGAGCEPTEDHKNEKIKFKLEKNHKGEAWETVKNMH